MKPYIIETDNRTTWVHVGAHTVGRICPVSAEIFGPPELEAGSNPQVFGRGRGDVVFPGTPQKTFERFRRMLAEMYGINVPDEARPTITSMQRDKLRQIARGEIE